MTHMEGSVVKRGTRHCLIVAISGMCLWIASSCATRQPTSPPARLPAPSSQQTVERASSGQWVLNQYADLPVPRGYEYKPDQSFVFAQEGLRTADLRYEGDLPVEELIRFYQDSMPTSGWKFLRLTGMRMKTITFTKDGEMCEIIIMSVQPQRVEDSDWQSSPRVSTHLHIKVNPF